PWRQRRIIQRKVRGRIGAEPDEGGLAERGLASDAGQQHESQRNNAIEADVVEQRDPEWRRCERRGQQRCDKGKERRPPHRVTLLPRDGVWSASARAAPG